jgi:hypothetical protein
MPRQYEDFKYVLQDTYSVYLGAQYTIEELIENEDIPIKLRIIIERYLYDEDTKNWTLETYFNQMQDKSLYYKVYKQLKTKLRVSFREDEKNGRHKDNPPYQTKTLSIEELMKISPEEKRRKEMSIQEVSVSKLAMMSF